LRMLLDYGLPACRCSNLLWMQLDEMEHLLPQI
jgi:hypothetical protein